VEAALGLPSNQVGGATGARGEGASHEMRQAPCTSAPPWTRLAAHGSPPPPPACPVQVLALFNKAVRKLYGHLRAAKEAAVERTLPKVGVVGRGGVGWSALEGECMPLARDVPTTTAGGCRNCRRRCRRPRHRRRRRRRPPPLLTPPPPPALLQASARPVLAPAEGDVDAELDAAAEAVRQEMQAAFRPEDLQQYSILGERQLGAGWPGVCLLAFFWRPAACSTCLPAHRAAGARAWPPLIPIAA